MKQTNGLKRTAWNTLKGRRGTAAFLTLSLISVPFIANLAEKGAGLLLKLTYFSDVYQTPDNFLDNRLSLQPTVLVCYLAASLLLLLIGAPLKIGTVCWYLHLTGGNPPSMREAFRYFASFRLYGKAVWFQFRLFLKKTAVFLLCFFPVILLYACLPVLEKLTFPSSLGPLLFLLSFLLLSITAWALAVYFNGRYFLAEYLWVLYSCHMKDAIHLSVHIMKSRKNALFSFRLSLLPYLLAELFLLPILWTEPFRQAAYARFAQQMMEEYQFSAEQQDKEPEQAVKNLSVPVATSDDVSFATKEFPFPAKS